MGIPKGYKYKSESEYKSELINIRLTPAEKEKLLSCAERMKTSNTNVIKHGIDLVDKQLKRKGN